MHRRVQAFHVPVANTTYVHRPMLQATNPAHHCELAPRDASRAKKNLQVLCSCSKRCHYTGENNIHRFNPGNACITATSTKRAELEQIISIGCPTPSAGHKNRNINSHKGSMTSPLHESNTCGVHGSCALWRVFNLCSYTQKTRK